MKQILVTIIILTSTLSYGQSFEGTLTYVANLEVSKKLEEMGMSKKIILDKMRSEGSWSDTIRTSYKQGDYYNLTNNNPRTWAVYKSETNKIYSMQDGAGSDICTVTDASVDLEFKMTGKMPHIYKLDSTAIVEGVKCNIVRVKWKSGVYDYYFNSTKLTVDPLLFTTHIYDGWAEFLKISKSLPLKIVKSTNGMMEVTMTLVSIKPEAIKDELFSIPTLVPDNDLNFLKLPNREIMRIKK
ncbi:hypothetical protein [Pedobacter cryophilus]|uniref:Outer membrane lipoprotein-sorting protein n=1 Tax=Pedobacter cryophilus TaxID=2571271 RepID=A0A4U1C471_9SPHI|nr:hypothetical protein [Pedobacter cryophilus]TKC00676.1 hypothetical protein FA046_03075 [Pedobacter cryophilus]